MKSVKGPPKTELGQPPTCSHDPSVTSVMGPVYNSYSPKPLIRWVAESYNGGMTNHEVFTHIDPDLLSVFEELRRREPSFIQRNSAPHAPTSKRPQHPNIGRRAHRAAAIAASSFFALWRSIRPSTQLLQAGKPMTSPFAVSALTLTYLRTHSGRLSG